MNGIQQKSLSLKILKGEIDYIALDKVKMFEIVNN